MFICGFCKELSKPRERSTLVVVEKRVREYYRVDLLGKEIPVKPSRKRKGVKGIAEGWEIVKEKLACEKCIEKISKGKELFVD